MTVTISAPLADSTLSVNMAENVVSPRNLAATNQGFNLVYAAPPCESDPCNLAAGIYSSACTNVDAVAGTYTCTCLSGRFGATCTDVCPTGYTLLSSFSPAQCVKVTDPTQWDNVDCSADGGSFASIHSAAQNSAYQSVCDTATGGDECWLAGSDQAVEGTWVWADGSSWDFETWFGSNPDDSQAFGGQDCVVIRSDGEW